MSLQIQLMFLSSLNESLKQLKHPVTGLSALIEYIHFKLVYNSTMLFFQALCDAGLVPGGDMTPEAALSKLSYVLARKDLATQEKKKVFWT